MLKLQRTRIHNHTYTVTAELLKSKGDQCTQLWLIMKYLIIWHTAKSTNSTILIYKRLRQLPSGILILALNLWRLEY